LTVILKAIGYTAGILPANRTKGANWKLAIHCFVQPFVPETGIDRRKS